MNPKWSVRIRNGTVRLRVTRGDIVQEFELAEFHRPQWMKARLVNAMRAVAPHAERKTKKEDGR